MDTTSVDNAALALEARAYYVRRAGSDGFQIGYRPTLKKVVNDKKASLDYDTDVLPSMRCLVQKEFDKGASIQVARIPANADEVPDAPRLTLVPMSPDLEWTGSSVQRQQVAEWAQRRGTSDRLYPAALVWCFRKSGRDLRNKVETWLAWRRVADDLGKRELGADFDQVEAAEVRAQVSTAEQDAREEVWASYTFVVLAQGRDLEQSRGLDDDGHDGLVVLDPGGGRPSQFRVCDPTPLFPRSPCPVLPAPMLPRLSPPRPAGCRPSRRLRGNSSTTRRRRPTGRAATAMAGS